MIAAAKFGIATQQYRERNGDERGHLGVSRAPDRAPSLPPIGGRLRTHPPASSREGCAGPRLDNGPRVQGAHRFDGPRPAPRLLVFLACLRGPFSQQIEPGTLGNSTSVRNAITRSVVLGSEPAHYFTSAALNQDSHDEFSAEVSAAGHSPVAV
jgi:hypothetical protein